MNKILVIEDEEALREAILDLLETEGFATVGAENGEQGLQIAQEVCPHLIICDVMMPKLDGYEVLYALRQNPETALIPFIFLTAKAALGDVREGMNLGADDYLVKPFKQDDLLEAIASRLNKQSAILNLQDQILTLEQSNVLKDEFLSAASEELRGPLTNISLAVKMLRKAPTPEKIQRYTNLLDSECTREMRLINHLVEFQRLDTGSRPLRPEQLDLQRWLPIMIEPYRKQAQEKQQLLQLILPPYITSMLIDAADLGQVLGELLDNACKYTPARRKIVLEVARSPRPTSLDGRPSLVTTFTVSNEAEIPMTEIPKLFDKFYRVPSSLSKADSTLQQSGNGLGLTLVKRLVERLEGTMHVISEENWTYFMVQLSSQADA